MKTSTLCTGCLSLMLLAAGAAGLMDASVGPRAEGERSWSPLATVSDLLAAWMTPDLSGMDVPIQPAFVLAQPVLPRQPKAPVALRIITRTGVVAADAPAAPPCVQPHGVFVVLPEWDCEQWKALNAESLKTFRTTDPKVKKSMRVVPAGARREARATETAQRA